MLWYVALCCDNQRGLSEVTCEETPLAICWLQRYEGGVGHQGVRVWPLEETGQGGSPDEGIGLHFPPTNPKGDRALHRAAGRTETGSRARGNESQEKLTLSSLSLRQRRAGKVTPR